LGHVSFKDDAGQTYCAADGSRNYRYRGKLVVEYHTASNIEIKASNEVLVSRQSGRFAVIPREEDVIKWALVITVRYKGDEVFRESLRDFETKIKQPEPMLVGAQHAKAIKAVVSMAVGSTVGLVLLVAVAGLLVKAHVQARRARQPVDFKQLLQRYIDAGDISLDTAAGKETPRELDRHSITMLEKVGSGR
jgi:hypothetical protein